MIDRNNRAFLLVVGVSFFLSTTLHPFYHDHFEDYHDQFEDRHDHFENDFSVIDCLACPKDISTPTVSTESIFYSHLIERISREIASPFIAETFSTPQSRAPPKT